MRFFCPTCTYESEDSAKFTEHLIACAGEPENKWDSYINLDVDRVTQIGKLSDQLEEEK